MILTKTIGREQRFFIGAMVPRLDHPANWHTLDEIRESIADLEAATAEARRPSLESVAAATYAKKRPGGAARLTRPAPGSTADLVEDIDPVAIYRRFNAPKRKDT